ncbi:hypothetical protein EVAR_50244_1 [Eumeta japonica]|uniref:Uncharacterized protein n=1 Tax=Eumeta variegata TaxID=151549 RepID=A0A4C1YLP2_EUMVA|nr:hypothetical protein EVAR_50244_1 [Eumeta japonica]
MIPVLFPIPICLTLDSRRCPAFDAESGLDDQREYVRTVESCELATGRMRRVWETAGMKNNTGMALSADRVP